MLPGVAVAQTQMQMNQQASAEFRIAAARLDLVYARVLRDSDPHRQDLLRQAERDWVAYRDAECAYRTAGSEGGSIHPLEIISCRTELTRVRTRALERSDCKPGDPACQ